MRAPTITQLLLALAAVALLARAAGAAPGDRSRDPYDEVDDELAGELDDDAPFAIRAGDDADTAGASRVAGPPIADVLAQAYRTAGLDRDPTRSWNRRSRIAGLIPWVTVRTGRNTSWQDLDPDVDRGTTIEVRAMWRLDRLLFDSRELQVASIDAARLRERRRLASRVIRAYFHWRRMAAAAASQPHRASRAEEAAAELDAITDGWFSEALARRGPRRAPGASRR